MSARMAEGVPVGVASGVCIGVDVGVRNRAGGAFGGLRCVGVCSVGPALLAAIALLCMFAVSSPRSVMNRGGGAPGETRRSGLAPRLLRRS